MYIYNLTLETLFTCSLKTADFIEIEMFNSNKKCFECPLRKISSKNGDIISSITERFHYNQKFL